MGKVRIPVEMTDAEETKRLKAKNLRFKKPICRDLNLDTIKENLYDIMCECEKIRRRNG